MPSVGVVTRPRPRRFAQTYSYAMYPTSVTLEASDG